MGQAQINVRIRACSRTSIARTKQAALTHNVRGKELMQPAFFFFFYDIKSKRISHRHSCNVYMRSLCGTPQMSPPPHDLERLRTTMVDFIVIFNRGRSVVSWTLYG